MKKAKTIGILSVLFAALLLIIFVVTYLGIKKSREKTTVADVGGMQFTFEETSKLSFQLLNAEAVTRSENSSVKIYPHGADIYLAQDMSGAPFRLTGFTGLNGKFMPYEEWAFLVPTYGGSVITDYEKVEWSVEYGYDSLIYSKSGDYLKAESWRDVFYELLASTNSPLYDGDSVNIGHHFVEATPLDIQTNLGKIAIAHVGLKLPVFFSVKIIVKYGGATGSCTLDYRRSSLNDVVMSVTSDLGAFEDIEFVPREMDKVYSPEQGDPFSYQDLRIPYREDGYYYVDNFYDGVEDTFGPYDENYVGYISEYYAIEFGTSAVSKKYDWYSLLNESYDAVGGKMHVDRPVRQRSCLWYLADLYYLSTGGVSFTWLEDNSIGNLLNNFAGDYLNSTSFDDVALWTLDDFDDSSLKFVTNVMCFQFNANHPIFTEGYLNYDDVMNAYMLSQMGNPCGNFAEADSASWDSVLDFLFGPELVDGAVGNDFTGIVEAVRLWLRESAEAAGLMSDFEPLVFIRISGTRGDEIYGDELYEHTWGIGLDNSIFPGGYVR